MGATETNPMTAFEPGARWAEDLSRARAALGAVTDRLAEMLRGARHPEANAIGDWSVAEVAAHLSHICMADLFVARSVGDPLPQGLALGNDLIAMAADFNATSLQGDPERDLTVLAGRIEDSVGEFLDAMKGLRGDEAVTWLGGVVIPASAPACHLLEELLVHGYDIARAEDRPWPIERDHAALGFGFVIDALRFANPDLRRAFVDQDSARNLNVCYDFRMRGARRDFFVFEDGLVTIEEPSTRKVDCHISADPVAALLLGMGRIERTKPALTGKMVAWGRRPWLAFKMGSLLRSP